MSTSLQAGRALIAPVSEAIVCGASPERISAAAYIAARALHGLTLTSSRLSESERTQLRLLRDAARTVAVHWPLPEHTGSQSAPRANAGLN